MQKYDYFAKRLVHNRVFCIALRLFLTFGITKTIESAIPVIAAIGEMVAGWVENSEKKWEQMAIVTSFCSNFAHYYII